MGHPCFDLGNLSVNNDFDEATDERLLRAYHGAPADGARARDARADAHPLRRARGRVGRRAGARSPSSTSTSTRYAREHFERLRRGRRAATVGGMARHAARAADAREEPMARPRELPDRARVVIIGGGVGGASIAHHLAKLGERDVVLLERNELTSGSTFHSAGLVGQLRSSVSLTRMMMDSVELYRTLDCGWVQCGGIRLACTPEREQEVLRQVAWAKTFGLPLELISAERGARAVPADEHRRRALRLLPAERRLPRPVAADDRARRRRARGRLSHLHAHARHRRSTSIAAHAARVACAACRPSGARSRPRSSSTPAACSPPRSGGWPACACRSCRSPTSTSSRSRFASAAARGEHLPTLRDPDLLIYFREEGGGLVMGGYERDSAPWALDEHLLDAIPPDFNGRLLEEDWPRFEEIAANSRKRVPVMDEITVTRADQRAGGVHARQRVLPRRERGARLLRRRRLLRARPRRRRRHRAA